ncbi:MAG: long-chain acyl-CoA synthetase [Maribacter sp.]|jgi:long-chain acyl-CoA synthetase
MQRLFDLLYHQAANFPIDNALNARGADGQWKSYSSQKVLELAELAASGLLNLGFKPGDKIAITSYINRPEWVIMDFAIQMAGMISIPMYPTISPSEYEFILNEAEVKAAFCGGLDLFNKLSQAQKNSPKLSHIYAFEQDSKGTFWETLFDISKQHEVVQIMAEIKTDDLATIIYTSGTTGNPKGVMLSHKNIMHVILETSKFLPLTDGDKVISFLPLCHVYERAVSFAYCYRGAAVYFCGTDNLSGPDGDLANVKPIAFTTVPRLLEKVYEAIYNKGLILEGVQKKIFFWALELTDGFELDQKLSFTKKLQWKIANKLIFSKWRDALGGNIRLIVTGAAPCPSKILRVFCAAGIPVREAYGLTETSPTLTINGLEPGGTYIGTVGYAIPGVSLKIDPSDGNYADDEGEILAYGPNIMQGYYKKPEINAKVFKEIDGKKWFCTGDIGKLIKNATGNEFLKITDRKKELLKTSGGKYVAPAPIENKMKEDFLIAQMMVVGDKQKFVTALILPSEASLKNWCQHKKLGWTTLDDMIQHKEVISKFQKVVDTYNPLFSHIEQVKKFKLISSPWLPIHEDGAEAELTPTLKLKRRVIREKFKNEITALYS